MPISYYSNLTFYPPSPVPASTLEVLFAEELGWVLEVSASQQAAVCEAFSSAGVHCHVIGTSHTEKQVCDVI